MSPIKTLCVLATILVLLLSGCGPKRAAEPKPTITPVPAATTTVTTTATSGQQPAGENTKPPPTVLPDQPPKPQLALIQRKMTLRWVEGGKLRMEATADEFRGNEVAQTGELLGFHGKLYENGKLTATMDAPNAIADTANRIVTATGGVKLQSMERKTSLTSQWVKWYARKQKVVGNGGVKINSTVGTVDAASFEADTGLKMFSVKGSPPKR